MTISERLFETAIQDLNSVEILFESEHYNLALFQLQQSVEKFVKSFGIKTNVIKPEDIAKKINHLPHKVFTRLYQKQIEELSELNETPSLIPDIVPPHQRGNNKIKDDLEKTKNLRNDILNNAVLYKTNEASIEDIEKFIKGAQKLEILPVFDEDKLYTDFKDDFVKTNEHFIEYFKGDENVKTISGNLIENSDEIVKNKVRDYKKNGIRQSKFGYVSYVWINLSLITSVHEQSTRYPSTENENNPSDLYHRNHNLIKHIPEFIKMMEKTITNFKQVYEK